MAVASSTSELKCVLCLLWHSGTAGVWDRALESPVVSVCASGLSVCCEAQCVPVVSVRLSRLMGHHCQLMGNWVTD